VVCVVSVRRPPGGSQKDRVSGDLLDRLQRALGQKDVGGIEHQTNMIVVWVLYQLPALYVRVADAVGAAELTDDLQVAHRSRPVAIDVVADVGRSTSMSHPVNFIRSMN
jgi:hypothetical protein